MLSTRWPAGFCGTGETEKAAHSFGSGDGWPSQELLSGSLWPCWVSACRTIIWVEESHGERHELFRATTWKPREGRDWRQWPPSIRGHWTVAGSTCSIHCGNATRLYLETKFPNSLVCEKLNPLWKNVVKISPEFLSFFLIKLHM